MVTRAHTPSDHLANQNPEGMSMRELLREDFIAHKRDWGRLGLRALVVHRFGNWRMGISSRLLRVPLSVLYRVLFRHCRARYGIEIPYTARLGRRVAIEHHSGIVINGGVIVGDDVVIRQNTTLGVRTAEELAGLPVIGNRVDIGVGAVVLGDVRVGDGATIGANAVVLQDVPDGCLAVGVPARIIERGSDDGESRSSGQP